jgi:hypothetical protein
MNFADWTAKIDQHMQRLADHGVSEAHAINQPHFRRLNRGKR